MTNIFSSVVSCLLAAVIFYGCYTAIIFAGDTYFRDWGGTLFKVVAFAILGMGLWAGEKKIG